MTTKLRYAAFLISFVILGLALSPNAQADMWNKKTILTFSGPVKVANTTLPAGTYVFKLADTADRHVVQIFNQDETHVYATVLANGAYRLEPPDHTVIRFAETASSGAISSGTLPPDGLPVKQWFYPGDNAGIEFPVRPAALAETAEALPAPAPPVASETAPAPEPAPSAEPEPPAQTAEAQPAPSPQPAPQAQEPAPTTDSSAQPGTPSSLPKTASPVPLIGLIGLLSLGTAAGLGLAARRQH